MKTPKPLKTSKKDKRKPKKDGLHPHVVISGYYGFDNLGDELILQVLIDELKAHKIDITVLSQNPKKTAEKYGVKAIKRTSFVDIVDALAQANLFISGGGGLFQDATGPMSAIYYGGLIRLADFFEVPVCFWAQGVGPLRRKLSRWMTTSALQKCEVIAVRDEGSAKLVQELMGTAPEITADPVWLLNVNKKKHQPAKSTEKKGKKKPVKKENPWRIGISLRPWKELTDARLNALASCLLQMAETSNKPVEFLLLPFQVKEDTELMETFAKKLADCHNATVRIIAPDAVMRHIGECQLLVGMRFHSLILGLLHNIPVYGLVYDPKVASLLEMFQLKGKRIADLRSISGDEILEYLGHYPTVDLKPFKTQSRRNVQILEQLLDIPEAALLI